ncbi:MAG: CoA transferase [Dehalococcoidales bacterium]|nr:CoA transferase [Dehalococcoidales bacterium]
MDSKEKTSILSDLRVVEISESAAGTYCGKLLADYGAEVIKIEKPSCGDDLRRAGPFPGDSPDPECSGLFLFLNTNKMGMTLNLADTTGRQILQKLCREADILVLGLSPDKTDDLNCIQLLKDNPKIIIVACTPFGLTSPYRDYAATELTMQHMSGVPYFTPGDVENPEKDPPVRLAGRQAELIAGITGALAVLLAVSQREMTGTGQIIDLAIRDVPLLSNIWNLGVISYTGKQPVRYKGKTPMAPQHILPCKNGYIQLSCNEESQWAGFLQVIGNPEWAKADLFKDRFLRGAHWESLMPLLVNELQSWEKEKIVDLAQAAGVPCTIVSSPADLLNSPQLIDRGFFVRTANRCGELVFPGSPFRTEEMTRRNELPAPRLGEHNEEIFCARLGYNRQQLAVMKSAGII